MFLIKMLFRFIVMITVVVAMLSCYDGDDTTSGLDDNTNGDSTEESSPYPNLTGVSASQTGVGEVTVTWNAATDDLTPKNEILYEVYLDKEENFNFGGADYFITVLGNTEAEITGLEVDKTYYVLVIAVDESGNQSKERDYQSIFVDSNPRFSGLTLVAPADVDKITLAWATATDDNTPAMAMTYEIHLSDQEDFEPTAATLHTSVIGETKKVVSSLNQGETYQILVVAIDQDGNMNPERDHRSATTFAEPIVISQTVPFHIDEELGLSNAVQNGTEYTFSNFNSFQLPEIGSILFIHVDDEIHLRKVESVKSTATGLVVQTSDAMLSEIVEKGTISSQVTIQSSGENELIAQQLTDSTLIDNPHSDVRQIATSQQNIDNQNVFKTTGLSDVNVDFLNKCVSYKGDFIKACWTLNFNPTIDVKVPWEYGRLTEGHAIVSGVLDGTIKISMKADGSLAIPDEIASIPVFKKSSIQYYLLFGVFVYQITTFSLNVEFSAHSVAELNAQTTVNFNGSALVGARFNPISGKWESVNNSPELDFFLTDSDAEPKLDGMAQAKISLVPSVSVDFYAVAGPKIAIKPSVEAKLNVDKAEPLSKIGKLPIQLSQFDVDGKLALDIGVSFGAFGNFPTLKTTIGTKEWNLLSLPKLSVSGGSGKVNESIQVTGSTTDGTNNKFKESSIRWHVDPSASISGDKTGTLRASEEDTYTVFFSGTGETTSAIRQFAWADVNVGEEEEEQQSSAFHGVGDACHGIGNNQHGIGNQCASGPDGGSRDEDNKKHGVWTYIFSSGGFEKNTYVHGVRNGSHGSWTAECKPIKSHGNYANSKKDGIWKYI